MDILDELQAMADDDLNTEGVWTADTANERCARYAELIRQYMDELGEV